MKHINNRLLKIVKILIRVMVEKTLILFKIMKRGDKLDKALASGVTSQNENVLKIWGLRYDLTLPLSRYFANNGQATLPMKCIQMDGMRSENVTTEG